MSSISPRLLRAGLVLVNSSSGQTQQVIVLQYNPDTLSRTLQPQAAGPESGDRIEALRLKGPPVETLKVDAELDATDQLEAGAGANGLHPHLAALEMLVYPTVSDLRANQRMANAGTLEIVPIEQPLTLFIWGGARILPVRITEFSITEEAFDPLLNPIRAKVSLAMRVLSVNDLPSDHRGAQLYLAYQSQKESLASQFRSRREDLGVKLPE